jgi:hypothetical protein
MTEPLVSLHGGKRNGCWATIPDGMCPIDVREGCLTCVGHAHREALARELEREIQRMIDEEDTFIAVGAAAVMNYGRPRR